MKNPKVNWKKSDGLIPAIIQDANAGQVLMLAYMNRAALEKTLKTKKVWFHSRSRKRLWMKGEESGNELSFVNIQSDCDGDALLVRANPTGPTCHTGQVSCFSDAGELDNAIIDLYKIIEGRKRARPLGSYTASLFKAGIDRICTKVAEESGEVIKAATKESNKRLTEESVDLIYHLFVLLAQKGLKMEGLLKEFAKRMK